VGMEVGEREIRPIDISLHCHHHIDSCIKMSSDENHFNVSLIVRDKVTKTVSANHNLFEEKGSRSGLEPKPLCLPAQRLTARPNRCIYSLPDDMSCHSSGAV